MVEVPLKQETRQFLTAYRESNEFRFSYGGNLALTGDLDRLSEYGKRRGLWARAFVEKVFSLETVGEAERLLEPWSKWRDTHSAIWSEYYKNSGGTKKEIDMGHKEADRKFAAVEIPAEIRAYQGDLQDEELRSLAHWEIFKLTKEVHGGIDLIEKAARPVPLETIFRVQRIMNRPFFPAGGLEPNVVNKPSVRRVEQGGKNYIAFDFDGEPADFGTEDPSSEEEWQRWNRLEVGTRVRYLREDRQTKQKTVETGVVRGFDLLGAGDAMLFGPSVGNIGIVVTNEQTQFFQCPLVSDIRIEPEPVTPILIIKELI